MEHNMMTFDELWEHEECQGLQQRLQQEYPVWKRQRRQRRTMLAAAMVVVVLILPFTFQHSSSRQYDGIVCNRNGIADTHWADVAANILTASTI